MQIAYKLSNRNAPLYLGGFWGCSGLLLGREGRASPTFGWVLGLFGSYYGAGGASPSLHLGGFWGCLGLLLGREGRALPYIVVSWFGWQLLLGCLGGVWFGRPRGSGLL